MMTYDPLQTYALGTIQSSPYAGMQASGINPLAFGQQTGALQGYTGGIPPYGTIHPQQQLALLGAQNPLLAAALQAQLTGGAQHPILAAIQNPLFAAQHPLFTAGLQHPLLAAAALQAQFGSPYGQQPGFSPYGHISPFGGPIGASPFGQIGISPFNQIGYPLAPQTLVAPQAALGGRPW
jgi:hypothetical protein